MGQAVRKGLSIPAAVLGVLILLSHAGVAQKTTAVPKLDLAHFITAWHVQAWMPNKAEKRCVSNVVVLYAAGDKPNGFQTGTFCQRKNGSTEEWSSTGKQDKSGSGKLKLRKFVIFSSPYWVLDADPEYRWALVGTPNHKRLWVLSKAATIPPELLTVIETKAAAQGFDTGKLVKIMPNAQAL